MSRGFAVTRSVVVSCMFVSIWVWFLPRYFIGAEAFRDARGIGWIVILCGALISGACMWEFAWRGLGTPAPWDAPRRLVVSGLYRWVRNPMYLGLEVMLAGEAITFPHLTRMLVLLMPALWVVITALIVFSEERVLRRKFGAEYDQYCRQVRRWIPRSAPFDKAVGVS